MRRVAQIRVVASKTEREVSQIQTVGMRIPAGRKAQSQEVAMAMPRLAIFWESAYSGKVTAPESRVFRKVAAMNAAKVNGPHTRKMRERSSG